MGRAYDERGSRGSMLIARQPGATGAKASTGASGRSVLGGMGMLLPVDEEDRVQRGTTSDLVEEGCAGRGRAATYRAGGQRVTLTRVMVRSWSAATREPTGGLGADGAVAGSDAERAARRR
jgi:hypothetical protein